MRLFDTHCHLDDRAFRDVDVILARAWRAGLVGALCAAADLGSSRAAIALAHRDRRLWASVGVHPHSAASDLAARGSARGLKAELRTLAKGPKVVAVGEAGLDFYRDLSPRPVQKDVFRLQAELARELGLPLIVHDRDAHAETLAILREVYGRPAAVGAARPGVLHCFSGDLAMAEACLDLGFYISFAGPLTYPKADETRRVAAAAPSDRILVETDSPYLAPQSLRGKRNEPALVAEVTARLAEVRGISVEETGSLTTDNAYRLFAIEGR